MLDEDGMAMARASVLCAAILTVASACGGGGSGGLNVADNTAARGKDGGAGPTFDFDADVSPSKPAPGDCGAPSTPAGPEVVIAPEYASTYKTYDLGPIPGAPPSRLGGCVFKHDDPNTLLVAVASEEETGAIYAVKVKREKCGHIVGFDAPRK